MKSIWILMVLICFTPLIMHVRAQNITEGVFHIRIDGFQTTIFHVEYDRIDPKTYNVTTYNVTIQIGIESFSISFLLQDDLLWLSENVENKEVRFANFYREINYTKNNDMFRFANYSVYVFSDSDSVLDPACVIIDDNIVPCLQTVSDSKTVDFFYTTVLVSYDHTTKIAKGFVPITMFFGMFVIFLIKKLDKF